MNNDFCAGNCFGCAVWVTLVVVVIVVLCALHPAG